jgi:hypothetical protein
LAPHSRNLNSESEPLRLGGHRCLILKSERPCGRSPGIRRRGAVSQCRSFQISVASHSGPAPPEAARAPWRLVAAFEMHAMRLSTFRCHLCGPVTPVGSATDTQETQGEKCEETSNGHDGSPPSSGNCRILMLRFDSARANKRARLSQRFFPRPRSRPGHQLHTAEPPRRHAHRPRRLPRILVRHSRRTEGSGSNGADSRLTPARHLCGTFKNLKNPPSAQIQNASGSA